MNSGAPTSAMIAPTGSCRGRGDRSRHQVGGGQQGAAEQVRGRRDDAVIAGAEGQPHGVRGDQADETDRAGAHHGDGRQRRATR